MKTKTSSSLIPIGSIQKAHGIKGEILLRLDFVEKLEPFPKMLYFCEGSPVQSCEVLKARFVPQGYLLQLKNCSHRDEALKLQGLKIYIDSNDLRSKEKEALFLAEFLGFRVHLQNSSQTLGTVSHFLSHSHQDLLVVSQNGKNIEIPFVQAYIKDIDFKNKTLLLTLPENFLSIF